MSEKKMGQINVLEANMQKIADVVSFYENQAKRSSDPICGSFLQNAADKKRIQLLILERMAFNRGIEMSPGNNSIEKSKGIWDSLHEKGLEDIFNFVNKQAIQDLKLYSLLSQEGGISRPIFKTMATMEEDFLSFIETDYLNQLSYAVTRNNKAEEFKVLKFEFENTVA